MSTIKFRIAAKTDVGLVRTNNEDNFQAASDLTSPQMRWVNNEICSLGEKGALLVVADGMGGMNAGEVASELAIETIKVCFAPENITPEVIANRYNIERFMNTAIVKADAQIKATGKERPETKGMGTTIVVGWLLKGKLYVSWCGDSRAYVYNPEAGLHQITKDHSYVQSLVDKGSISPEDAFDYPDSNIITRSLSDGGGKAKPESLFKPYEVCDNDIILLCTDGLCGMIRDQEIESVLQANEHNMDQCADALIHAACEAQGADNITVCLCQILQGGSARNSSAFEDYDERLRGPLSASFHMPTNHPAPPASNNYKKYFFIAVGTIACLLCIIAVESFFLFQKKGKTDVPAVTCASDSCRKSVTPPPTKPDGSSVPNIEEEAEGNNTPATPTPPKKNIQGGNTGKGTLIMGSSKEGGNGTDGKEEEPQKPSGEATEGDKLNHVGNKASDQKDDPNKKGEEEKEKSTKNSVKPIVV